MAIQDITNRARRLGIDNDNNTPSFQPSEEQQISTYMSKNNPSFDAGNKNSLEYNNDDAHDP